MDSSSIASTSSSAHTDCNARRPNSERRRILKPSGPAATNMVGAGIVLAGRDEAADLEAAVVAEQEGLEEIDRAIAVPRQPGRGGKRCRAPHTVQRPRVECLVATGS